MKNCLCYAIYCQYVQSDQTSCGSRKRERHYVFGYGCIYLRHILLIYSSYTCTVTPVLVVNMLADVYR